MRNRAKCRKCESIIESFHEGDYISCNCNEISVSGGYKNYCSALDWSNFIRVDDLGNEIVPKIVQKEETESIENIKKNKVTKREMISILDDMIKSIENLPSHAMNSPITHSDFASLLILLSSILRCEQD